MTARRALLRLTHLGLALVAVGVLAVPSAGAAIGVPTAPSAGAAVGVPTAPSARAAAAPLQATQPTDLLVRLINEAGDEVADQEVFVVVSSGLEVTDELTGTTDDDGEIRFEGVAVGTGYSARPVSVFEGYPYQGEAVSLTAGVETLLPLTVFTVSDSATKLHIEVFHLILNVLEPGVYQVVQVMSVLNVGERAAYSGEEFDGRRVGMVIPVPNGASGVEAVPQVSGLDPDSLAQDGDRLLDFRPVPPGNHQIAVQYQLLTDPDGGDIEITLPYPTARVSMLVGPGLGLVVIESDQLQELESVEIPGQGSYANFSSDVIAGGETLRFRIGPTRRPMSAGAWSLLALAVALFAGAGASIWFGAGPAPDPGERNDLIAEVARLDTQHESGALADPDYRAARGAAIGRLMELDGASTAARPADGE